MKCPKCGYVRRMGETAPEWQCPSCGMAYAKARAGADAEARARSQSAGGKLMMVLAVVACVASIGILWKKFSPATPPADSAPSQATQAPGEALAARTGVIMYSLTTCAFCVQKRGELQAAGIPFVEYYVDVDPDRMQELAMKLAQAGYRGGGFGTPTFDVNGTMLPNNPSLATIREYL